jgi:hypothetical protein
MGRLCLGIIVSLGLTLPACGQGVDPFVGTWKLNPAKSQFNPGPAPRSNTLTFEAVGQGLKVTAEGLDAQGNATKVVIGPYLYDGRSYPSPGASAFDASSYKMINNSTVEITRIKAGKVTLTETRVLSADGKVLTFTTTGQTNNIEVYEKQ